MFFSELHPFGTNPNPNPKFGKNERYYMYSKQFVTATPLKPKKIPETL